MKKNIFLLLLIAFSILLTVSCVQKIEEPEEEPYFVPNIPECFWGNWIVDRGDFINPMHFDIDQHHIYQWVENFDTADTAHDCSLYFYRAEDVEEKMYDPKIYSPLFGDIGYKQNASGISIYLQYDSLTDRVRYKFISIDKYYHSTEYTYYLRRAN